MKNIVAIDLGINNLLTVVSNIKESYIIDGKKIKYLNDQYNNGKIEYKKRNDTLDDYINKATNYIIKDALDNKIDVIVVGIVDTNKITNTYEEIPLNKIRKRLKRLTKMYNIAYVEQDESFTSKASFLDNDEIPNFNESERNEYNFSGKRIERGLYESKDGIMFNADVNAAFNIGRKHNPSFNSKNILKKFITTSPKRINVF